MASFEFYGVPGSRPPLSRPPPVTDDGFRRQSVRLRLQHRLVFSSEYWTSFNTYKISSFY